MSKYTEYEIQILKEKYPLGGSAECRKYIDREDYSIRVKASKLKIKAPYDLRWNKKPIKDLIDITTAEGAYLLGLVWAEGTLEKPNFRSSKVCVGLIKSDFDEIRYILENWPISERFCKNYPKHYKRFMIAQTSHKTFYKFLYDNDFESKSEVSPTKILNLISDDFKHYFFRGWFDGDGTLRQLGKRKSGAAISGSREQDWEELIKLCKRLGIDYKIQKKIDKRGQSGSDFYFRSGERGMRLLFNYIYSGKIFGLSRKYNDYQYYIKERNLRIKNRAIKPMGINSKSSKKYYAAYRTGAGMKYNHLGCFDSIKLAAEAYDKKIYELHKDLTRLNYPENYKNDPEYEKMGFDLF